MYDALYLTALAYLANGNHAVATSELTGGALASGLAELAPGQAATEIELGPDQLPQAIATLLANGRVDARGASGPLDFDISIGSPPLTDVELACMAMGTQPPDSIGWVSSGLEWDENTWSVVGALNCPR